MIRCRNMKQLSWPTLQFPWFTIKKDQTNFSTPAVRTRYSHHRNDSLCYERAQMRAVLLFLRNTRQTRDDVCYTSNESILEPTSSTLKRIMFTCKSSSILPFLWYISIESQVSNLWKDIVAVELFAKYKYLSIAWSPITSFFKGK